MRTTVEVKKHGVKWFGKDGAWPRCPECGAKFTTCGAVEVDEANGVYTLTKHCAHCEADFTITKREEKYMEEKNA